MINLIDFWRAAARHPGVFASIAVVCLVAGALLAGFRTERYIYKSEIEIGSYTQIAQIGAFPIQELVSFDNVTVTLLSPKEAVLSEIRKNYGPRAIEEARVKHQDIDVSLDATAVSKPRTEIIVLSSRGTQEQSPIHRKIHNSVIDQLLDAHSVFYKRIADTWVDIMNIRKREVSYLRKAEELLSRRLDRMAAERSVRLDSLQERGRRLEIQRDQIESDYVTQLSALKEQGEILQHHLDRLKAQREFLVAEVERIKDLIRNKNADQSPAEDTRNDQGGDLTQYLTSIALQGYRDRVTDIEERIEFDLARRSDQLMWQLGKNERDLENGTAQMALALEALSQQINANRRDREIEEAYESDSYNNLIWSQQEIRRHRALLERLIELYKSRISDIRETRVIQPFTRSASPTGPSGIGIVAVSGALGLILGFAGAFLAERFLGAAGAHRRRTADEGRLSV